MSTTTEVLGIASSDDDYPPVAPQINFDTSGDLVFLVGPTKQRFLVCSRAVCRISPVFTRMLRGNWAEAKPEGQDDWTVELPEDNEGALALIFNIVHAHFHEVKRRLSINELFEICVIFDKYKCVEVALPFASTWCNRDIFRNSSDDRLLWIAWVLGHEELFTSTAREVMATCYIDGESLVTMRSRVEEEFEYIDSIGVLDDIAEARLALIDSLLEPLATYYDRNLRPYPDIAISEITCLFPYNSPILNPQGEMVDCQCFHMGAFMGAVLKEGLFPIPTAKYIKTSINLLHKKLGWLEFESRSSYDEAHAACDLNYRIKPQFNQESEFSPGPRFLKYIRAQAVKTGLREAD